ncbi:MAG: phosphoribosylformimino-5-aminoimidazole carboxamide ribotide isomerase [Gammaproteobacteria bacterium]|jgi:phosphoribosylformimino-5-aminoimidazole carboxamide ribotide isomerase
MLIIPVIDLHSGNVVHAYKGQRESYEKIRTPLCHGSDPLVVVPALLSLYAFTTLYIADLNAIKDEGNNNQIIGELLLQYPDICFWIDSGKYSYPGSFPPNRLRHIIGTETGISKQNLLNQSANSNPVLSLDFIDQTLIGEKDILEDSDAWPDEIIVMTLSRVGSDQGPDLTRLLQIKENAAGKRIYAAGGVRNEDDLEQLKAQGISGVLVATSLHNGKISTNVLRKFFTTQ